MISGRRLDLLDPSPFDIEIDDIAHGLARVARWNGQTKGDHAFSVAEHSLLVEHICSALYPALEPKWRLCALLHDAPEYVIGDMISPFKAALGVDYRAFEDRLEAAIHMRFGLPPKTPKEVKRKIKRADRVCAWFEATQIAGFTDDESDRFFGAPPQGLHIHIRPAPPKRAQAEFIARFEALMAGTEQAARAAEKARRKRR
ncbi:MAG: HD family hydrolase [Maricaulaceae bacterium]|nr:HD family hydrolase [Maricaulaceae bacterium]